MIYNLKGLKINQSYFVCFLVTTLISSFNTLFYLESQSTALSANKL